MKLETGIRPVQLAVVEYLHQNMLLFIGHLSAESQDVRDVHALPDCFVIPLY